MIRKRTFIGSDQEVLLEFSNHVEERGGQVVSITYSGISNTVWVRVKGPEENWQSILKDWQHIMRKKEACVPA